MKKETEKLFKTYYVKNGYTHFIDVNYKEYIGFRFVQIKNEKNLSYETIIKRGGFSNASILTRIKNGKHAIQTDNLYKLCKGLGCKSSELLPF